MVLQRKSPYKRMDDVVRDLILTVDRNQRNLELLADFLQKAGYDTIRASSTEQVSQVIHDNLPVALALVDISGFDRTIWQYCEQLHAKEIPLLVLSPRQSSAIQQESLAHGARGMLVKPLVARELIALVHSLIED